MENQIAEKKTYRFTQFAASVSGAVLFEIYGSDPVKVQADAAAKIADLEGAGVVCLSALRKFVEVVPSTLANLAELGNRKQRRKARKLLGTGRYTGHETVNPSTGRWE